MVHFEFPWFFVFIFTAVFMVVALQSYDGERLLATKNLLFLFVYLSVLLSVSLYSYNLKLKLDVGFNKYGYQKKTAVIDEIIYGNQSGTVYIGKEAFRYDEASIYCKKSLDNVQAGDKVEIGYLYWGENQEHTCLREVRKVDS